MYDFKERFYFSNPHYLVADWVDDFEFKSMKTLIASYFHQSKSLPKSVTCALSYLKHPKIEIGDTLLVFYEESIEVGKCWLTPLVVQRAPKDHFLPINYPRPYIPSTIEQKPFDSNIYPKFPALQPIQTELVDKVLQLEDYEWLQVPKNVEFGRYYNRQYDSHHAYVDLVRLDEIDPPTARWFCGDIEGEEVILKYYCNEEMLEPGTLLRAEQ
ncbi:hypothetical protein [Helicobacter felis]|uniref:hypothetical protein n=1 Tax=Helicobacter felis TaxID=214 RepID=UPI000CF1B57F|nr:hypothetical protein [Helicobacter felis]